MNSLDDSEESIGRKGKVSQKQLITMLPGTLNMKQKSLMVLLLGQSSRHYVYGEIL